VEWSDIKQVEEFMDLEEALSCKPEYDDEMYDIIKKIAI